MYGLRGPQGLNMVNQALRMKIAYWPRRRRRKRRRRRRKIPGIGRYPMGPTINLFPTAAITGGKSLSALQRVGRKREGDVPNFPGN